jgi:hypothetical protein
MPTTTSIGARALSSAVFLRPVARAIAPPAKAVSAPSKKALLERFPITWNHVIDKESLKIKMLEQVLIEKVCQLFRNLL